MRARCTRLACTSKTDYGDAFVERAWRPRSSVDAKRRPSSPGPTARVKPVGGRGWGGSRMRRRPRRYSRSAYPALDAESVVARRAHAINLALSHAVGRAPARAGCVLATTASLDPRYTIRSPSSPPARPEAVAEPCAAPAATEGLLASRVASTRRRSPRSPRSAFTVASRRRLLRRGASRATRSSEIPLTVVDVDAAAIAAHWPDAVAHGEGLAINGHLVGKYLLSRAMRDAGYKVALTGEGADELFAGYPHLRQDAGITPDGHAASRGVMLPAGEALRLRRRARLGFVPTWIAARRARASVPACSSPHLSARPKSLRRPDRSPGTARLRDVRSKNRPVVDEDRPRELILRRRRRMERRPRHRGPVRFSITSRGLALGATLTWARSTSRADAPRPGSRTRTCAARSIRSSRRRFVLEPALVQDTCARTRARRRRRRAGDGRGIDGCPR